MTPEHERLRREERREENWKRWGTYLPERQWGTVREDYSANGDAWNSFPHDEARSRAYRWGEDGLFGWTDRECRLCFAPVFWNGRDPILKERLFGLTNPEGNHGEDVKECYHYLSATPTHSYASALYRYPRAAFPYDDLVATNRGRTREEREYELGDTGVFDEDGFFDCRIEYAKAAPEDVCIRITITNQGPTAARFHLLPMLWFRNTWSWGRDPARPTLERLPGPGEDAIRAVHPTLGVFHLALEGGAQAWLFTENETNSRRLGGPPTPFAKDAFHERVIRGETGAVNPKETGTRAAAWCQLSLKPGESHVTRLRLFRVDAPAAPQVSPVSPMSPAPARFADFEAIFKKRREEMEAFYREREGKAPLPSGQREIIRQAYAGLLWGKQFYHYIVKDWLEGDPGLPPLPPGHAATRNADWGHLYNRDVISMPDKWEYPWYAAWDLAFHMVPLARIDSVFAREQLQLFLREWYMHPNGQIPAYEWNFSDVNPPVHAWACWRVYKIGAWQGGRDRRFLESCFQKLLLNFTWWVNRKDISGKQLFSGGFLGLDNIGLFDRSQPLSDGEELEQADGTAWMAFYCGTMLSMALELARENPVYEDIASKFFEHFIGITDAMNAIGGHGLWHEEDGFYYDQLSIDGGSKPIRVRSLVGIIPLLAVEVVDQAALAPFPSFRKRARWFIENRPDLARHISYMESTDDLEPNGGPPTCRRMLAIPSRDRLVRVLRYVLDEAEFLSPYGVRSLSRIYEGEGYRLRLDGSEHCIGYEPGESRSGMFGGNSNWRGPIWMPVNYLLIEALERYHHFYGDTLKVECPTGSGQWMNLAEVAGELARRLIRLFEPEGKQGRPALRDDALSERYARDPLWRRLILFHEYFHGENGRGMGASHQTGWTALVARCIEMMRREAAVED